MRRIATGTFDVDIRPATAPDAADGVTLGRNSLEKRFHGDLEGAGRGEMLTVGTPVPGSAVYVAVERVTGTLQGCRGTLAFRHVGTLRRGVPELSIAVVPDSGTDQLSGIEGDFKLEIVGKEHRYTFEYDLPE